MAGVYQVRVGISAALDDAEAQFVGWKDRIYSAFGQDFVEGRPHSFRSTSDDPIDCPEAGFAEVGGQDPVILVFGLLATMNTTGATAIILPQWQPESGAALVSMPEIYVTAAQPAFVVYGPMLTGSLGSTARRVESIRLTLQSISAGRCDIQTAMAMDQPP